MSDTPIYGVDFSGSGEPGRAIWIAEGKVVDGTAIQIERTESAGSRFRVTSRDDIYGALRAFIADRRDAVFGLDFPFAFPERVVEADDWQGFLESFHEDFEGQEIDAFPNALDLDGHPKREHDVRYGGQSPFSPQVRYMVFHGLRDLLHQLVDEGSVSVHPMGPIVGGRASVIEVYPAATFGRHGLYRAGYKGNDDHGRRRRAVNFEGLDELPDVALHSDMRDLAIEHDDALDSICAAVATGKASRKELAVAEPTIEGHIYV